jgi:hypothetical protein
VTDTIEKIKGKLPSYIIFYSPHLHHAIQAISLSICFPSITINPVTNIRNYICFFITYLLFIMYLSLDFFLLSQYKPKYYRNRQHHLDCRQDTNGCYKSTADPPLSRVCATRFCLFAGKLLW